jgi:hypothetical protein
MCKIHNISTVHVHIKIAGLPSHLMQKFLGENLPVTNNESRIFYLSTQTTILEHMFNTVLRVQLSVFLRIHRYKTESKTAATKVLPLKERFTPLQKVFYLSIIFLQLCL